MFRKEGYDVVYCDAHTRKEREGSVVRHGDDGAASGCQRAYIATHTLIKH
jgi:hypothetical protein